MRSTSARSSGPGAGWCVTTPRGHGRSGGGKDESEYTWPNLARDLLAFLDALGADRAVSGIGASMGTATLLHAVTVAPDRFDRLVLTCPPTAWAGRAAQADVYRAGATFAERNGKDAFVAGMRALPPPPVLAELPEAPVDIDEALLPDGAARRRVVGSARRRRRSPRSAGRR